MSDVREAFTEFFEGWLLRQQSYLNKLQTLLEIPPYGTDLDDARMHLIEEVVGHYHQYYAEKSKAADQDIFLLFSPPWLSSFERTLLWMAGFKPSLIFRLVEGAVEDLTGDQSERIKQLNGAVKEKEREIGEAMARVQESVAAPPLYGLVRRAGRLVDGEVSDLDTAIDELKEAMVGIMGSADALRGTAAKEMLEILKPMQQMKLLVATAQFQLQSRRLGL